MAGISETQAVIADQAGEAPGPFVKQRPKDRILSVIAQVKKTERERARAQKEEAHRGTIAKRQREKEARAQEEQKALALHEGKFPESFADLARFRYGLSGNVIQQLNDEEMKALGDLLEDSAHKRGWVGLGTFLTLFGVPIGAGVFFGISGGLIAMFVLGLLGAVIGIALSVVVGGNVVDFYKSTFRYYDTYSRHYEALRKARGDEYFPIEHVRRELRGRP